MKSAAPKWMIDLLEWYCRDDLQEGILGDLQEKFHLDSLVLGPKKAARRFIWNGVRFLRWRFRRQGLLSNGSRALWSNYVRTTTRSMWIDKQYFGINLIGLMLAIACALFCLVLVQDELKFDRFHSDIDATYRVYKHHLNPAEDVDMLSAETSGLLAPTMESLYPEVAGFCRIYPLEDIWIYHEDAHFRSPVSLIADSSFFDLFSFDMVYGDPTTALVAPASVVLTESLAMQIFGNANPVGEKLTNFGDQDYQVTGVVQDPPRHSSIQFDQLISWTTIVPEVGPLSFSWLNNWLAQAAKTFVTLVPSASPDQLVQKLPDLMERYFPERADQYTWHLQPFSKVYLHSADIRYQGAMKLGSIRFIYILSLSAILILIIVLFNYLNISLSRASKHVREIGVRKVLGSTQWQLGGRFVIETLISTVLAAVLAYSLLIAVLPYLNLATGRDLPSDLLFDPMTIFTMVSICVVLSLLIGTYPAIVLSRPSAVDTIKGIRPLVGQRSISKNLLLAAQFGIALILLMGCLMVFRQTHFLKNSSLGFKKDNLLVIDVDNEVGEKADVFEAKLRALPAITDVSIGRGAIGWGNYSTTLVPEGRSTELGTRILIVDPDFFSTYGIVPIQGRSFLNEGISDSMSVIVNRTFVEAAQWSDPIGKRILGQGNSQGYPVIGVVDDFHYHSLASATIEPVAIFLSIDDNRCATVRLADGTQAQAMADIEKVWQEVATRTPLDYYFVTDWFNEQYSTEDQLLKTSTLYALISVFLCGLGLYGMTALMLQRRRREISVRKILGGSMASIIGLINRQVLSVLVLGSLLAVPIGYFVLQNWLEDFAYQTHLGISTLATVVFGILFLSCAIVTILAYRVAAANPSEVLQSE